MPLSPTPTDLFIRAKDGPTASLTAFLVILTKLPKNYDVNSENRYPVIYLTDSGYAFPLVSSLTKQMVGEGKIQDSVLVGISYSKEERGDVSSTRDYTPTNFTNEMIGFSKEAISASGGVNDFLKFIRNEVFPIVSGKADRLSSISD